MGSQGGVEGAGEGAGLPGCLATDMVSFNPAHHRLCLYVSIYWP